MTPEGGERELYLEQLRLTIHHVLAPELSSARAKDSALLCERILGGLIAGERAAKELDGRFARRLRALVRPGENRGGAPVRAEELWDLRAEAVEVVRRAMDGQDPAQRRRASEVVEIERAVIDETDALREIVLAEGSRAEDSFADQCSVDEGQLRAFLRGRLRSSPRLEVEELSLIPGGRSKETILVTLSGTAELPRRVVLRKDRPVGLLSTRSMDEFTVLKVVHEFGGVPVPEPYLAGQRGLGEGTFLLMELVPGSKAGEYFPELAAPREHREAIGRQIATALARLHSIPIDLVPAGRASLGRRPAVSETSVLAMVDSMDKQLNELSGPPFATAAVAVHWLREHRSDVTSAPRLSLLQGDFGFHNMLVDGPRLSALVDWEGATIGPPARELAAAWPVAAALMGWPDFLAAYRDGGGRLQDADPRAITYYRVLLALGGCLTSRMGGHLFRTGKRRDLLTANSGLDSQFRCMRNLTRALAEATGGS